jgi:hypothetical protein
MQFPHILVINLQHRIDRWLMISQQLNKENLSYERVDAVKRKDGWKGCGLSHKKAIQIANQRKYPWVLILEDDCLFLDGWKDRFLEVLPLLWERRKEWDVFSGGSFTVHSACKIQDRPPLFQFTGWSAHFILVHAGTYPRILRYRLGVSIDDTYRRTYRMWCTYPHLAIQTGGWSDNRQHTNSPSQFRRQFSKSDKQLKLVKRRCIPTSKHRRATLDQLSKQVRKTRKVTRHQ